MRSTGGIGFTLMGMRRCSIDSRWTRRSSPERAAPILTCRGATGEGDRRQAVEGAATATEYAAAPSTGFAGPPPPLRRGGSADRSHRGWFVIQGRDGCPRDVLI